MHKPIVTRVILAAGIFLCLSASTRGGATDNLVHATLLAGVDSIVPGSSFTLGVRLKIAPRYHTYWINPGEFGNPTRIKLTGPGAFEFGEIQWPLPSRIEHAGSVTFGYENEVLLMVPVKVATSAAGSGVAKIAANVSWLACDEECVPGAAKLEIELPIGAGAKPANVELFETWKKRLAVSKDQAADVLADVVQPNASDGAPTAALAIRWKTAPARVEWFPIATSAVAVDNIVVKHAGRETQISFKPTIFKPDDIPGGTIGSVLVYEDAKGVRHGIVIPIEVKKPNNAK